MFNRNFNEGGFDGNFHTGTFNRRRNKFKTFFVLILIAVVGMLFIQTFGNLKTETVSNCKVERLVQQQIINSNNNNLSTGYRYLIVTNKETFICESSLLNGKFNNSDVFWRLKEGETYDFTVVGYGKTFATDYRNVLEAKKVTE